MTPATISTRRQHFSQTINGDQVIEIVEIICCLTARTAIPDEPLPVGWQQVLRSWVAGVDVGAIGVDNMRLVEDVFAYRLVWALEALRTRRAAAGLLPELIDGTAAASLEAGVPKVTMSLLIRAGLLSRAAAIRAVNDLNPIYIDGREMAEWLRSNEVVALTDTGVWPTPATADHGGSSVPTS